MFDCNMQCVIYIVIWLLSWLCYWNPMKYVSSVINEQNKHIKHLHTKKSTQGHYGLCSKDILQLQAFKFAVPSAWDLLQNSLKLSLFQISSIWIRWIFVSAFAYKIECCLIQSTRRLVFIYVCLIAVFYMFETCPLCSFMLPLNNVSLAKEITWLNKG